MFLYVVISFLGFGQCVCVGADAVSKNGEILILIVYFGSGFMG